VYHLLSIPTLSTHHPCEQLAPPRMKKAPINQIGAFHFISLSVEAA
jgi:hypothetical protein